MQLFGICSKYLASLQPLLSSVGIDNTDPYPIIILSEQDLIVLF